MKLIRSLYAQILLSLLCITPLGANSTIFNLTTEKGDHDITLYLHANIAPGDGIYADSLMAFVDNAAITLSEWTASEQPAHRYDHQFRETKQIYQQPFTLAAHAYTKQLPTDADVHIHVTYFQQSRGLFAHERFRLTMTNDASTPLAANNAQQTDPPKSLPKSSASTTTSFSKFSISSYITNLFVATNSLWIRLILCLILGLLFSLTPCIYPMIPITIGILQAQRRPSFFHNFLLATCYAIGMSVTFALLGLFAAITGQLFGNLMTKPVVVLAIIALIVYLSFSMMGFYELRLPRFLSGNSSAKQGGSFLSAFLFGIASGTIVSPCLSPGLLLLLAVVSTLHNYLLGFLLLFSFGIGLTLPLLIIGTFSHSLHFLPRAGQWMVEIKRLLGLAMLATSFYFLKGIVTIQLFWWILTASSFASACLVFYFAYTSRHIWRLIHQIIGIILIVVSLFFALEAAKMSYATCSTTNHIDWITDYNDAHAQAVAQNKKLFVYLTAPFCPLCTAIERCILSHPAVMQQLAPSIMVKIDVSDESSDQVALLRKQYTILGVPVYLLIDPQTDETIGQWGSELYDKGTHSFADELLSLMKKDS